MIDLIILMIALGVFCASWAGCRGLEFVLVKYRILDYPDPRRNHRSATPHGGGIAVMAAWIGGMGALYFFAPNLAPSFNLGWLFIALTALMTISWIDDLRHVPAGVRIFIHILSVLIALPSLPGPLVPDWPLWLNTVMICGLWVWFINLYNFMDGIDGISGVEGLSISFGISIFALFIAPLAPLWVPIFLLGMACGGFLMRNWPPARIFLGDVGSIPLGFVLGWALLWLAASGQPIAALILPLYYLADSGLTLLRRIGRGEAFWRAHSEHNFQQAVRRGMSHAQVTLRIGFINVVLIAFALISLDPAKAPLALIGAILSVVLLLCHLTGDKENTPPNN